MQSSSKKQHIIYYMVDSVGAHRGMHYYTFALVSALKKLNSNTILISNSETINHLLQPKTITVREGFKHIYGNQPKLLRGLQYVISLLRIGRWARQEKPAVVHFHFFQMPFLDLILLKWLHYLGIPTISTVHDVLSFNFNENELEAKNTHFLRQLYQNSSGLIVQSNYTKLMLAKLDEKLLKKCQTISQGNYMALSQNQLPSSEEARNHLNLNPNDLCILIFGSIKPNKRLDIVINAMVDIIDKYPKARLLIVGQPWRQDITIYKDLAQELNISNHINWILEYVSDSEMINYFSSANIVVFPYQWIYQSAALIMAMSFGKPVIATKVGSNAEFVEDGHTGLLVPFDKVSAMSQAIISLLSNPDYATQLGEAAMQYVADVLSWEEIAKKTLRFYKQTLKQS